LQQLGISTLTLAPAPASQEQPDLTTSEDADLEALVNELEAAAGEPLRGSNATSAGLRSMCAATDPVRWRHRPLLYYAISHGLGEKVWTRAAMASAGYERRTHGKGADKLVYWYRPPQRDASSAAADGGAAGGGGEVASPQALLFIHGVGVGPAPYAAFLDMAAPDRAVPVVAVELAAPAQRLFPYPTAPPARFAKLVAGALDDLGIDRAVVSGHSLGSAYASYLAAADARGDLAPRAAAEGEGAGSGGYRRRVGGLVLIDPIACLLHQPGVSSQFIYTPVRSLKEAADDYYFKKVRPRLTPIAAKSGRIMRCRHVSAVGAVHSNRRLAPPALARRCPMARGPRPAHAHPSRRLGRRLDRPCRRGRLRVWLLAGAVARRQGELDLSPFQTAPNLRFATTHSHTNPRYPTRPKAIHLETKTALTLQYPSSSHLPSLPRYSTCPASATADGSATPLVASGSPRRRGPFSLSRTAPSLCLPRPPPALPPPLPPQHRPPRRDSAMR